MAVRADFDEDMYETLHITQAALSGKAKPGAAHTVFVGREGQKFAIGTLDAGRCAQFTLDLTLSMDEVELSHNGPSEVHLTGYRVEQMMGSDDEDEQGGYGHYREWAEGGVCEGMLPPSNEDAGFVGVGRSKRTGWAGSGEGWGGNR